jgi:hypothetical protein
LDILEFWNYSGISYSGIILKLAILELFWNWLFWNYSGIGYSGIIPELLF